MRGLAGRFLAAHVVATLIPAQSKAALVALILKAAQPF